MTSAQLDQPVNQPLTRPRRKRPTRYVEPIDFLNMVRRIVRAAGQRVGSSDVEELKALVAIRNDVDDAILEAVRGVRGSGATWADIGEVLGISRQGAEQRYGDRL